MAKERGQRQPTGGNASHLSMGVQQCAEHGGAAMLSMGVQQLSRWLQARCRRRVVVVAWVGGCVPPATRRCMSWRSMSWRGCRSHHHAIAQPNNDLANLSASSQPQTTFRFVQPGKNEMRANE